MKRILFVIFALVAFVLPSDAVLKEANLDTTLYILRTELTQYHLNLEEQNKGLKKQQQEIIKELKTINEQSNEISLMLYSQKNGYIFDMAYACSQATELYSDFQQKTAPFRRMIKENNQEVARFDSLMDNLSNMETRFLSKNAAMNRNVCLTLAANIRRQLKEGQTQTEDYQRIYNIFEARLKGLNDYAIKRYADIQGHIFNNKGDNYPKILLELGQNIREMTQSVSEKYKPVGNLNKSIVSQWDVRVIFFLFMLIGVYMLISIVLNFITIRIIVTRLMRLGKFQNIQEKFLEKRSSIMSAMTIVTFAIILGIIRMVVKQNFIIMSSNLLVEYAWLQGVILFSLLIRVSGEQIKNAYRIYLPLLAITFLVIAFRIVLIPNALLSLIFPPILILCSIWQFHMTWKLRRKVPKIDMFYSNVSLGIFIASVIASLIGYILLSVMLLTWWTMLLTCILTLTCLRDCLDDYAKRHNYDQLALHKKWLYRLVQEVIIPIIGVLSILISIYWAADIFNLSDTTMDIFNYKLKISDIIAFSLIDITWVVSLWILFKYLNSTVCEGLRIRFETNDPSTADSKYMMTKNVMQVLVWGLWLLTSIKICHISSTWFVYVSTGLSTGIGFAMKDILENIYYGISLMAGRIKLGDYIICDGVRGRVSKISYTSTMIDATDGAVIAFQNSQLFTKNYKNMTRNHGYELDILEVGVAYGTNVAEVKKLLIDELMGLDCIYHEKGVKVVLKSFDDSCITLKILVWVNVLTQYADDGKIMETIYDIFNEHGIEIPFPQREVTIKTPSTKNSVMTEEEKKALKDEISGTYAPLEKNEYDDEADDAEDAEDADGEDD